MTNAHTHYIGKEILRNRKKADRIKVCLLSHGLSFSSALKYCLKICQISQIFRAVIRLSEFCFHLTLRKFPSDPFCCARRQFISSALLDA